MHNSNPLISDHTSEPCECDAIREHFAKIIDNPNVKAHFLVAILDNNHAPVATAGGEGSKHLAHLCGLTGAMLSETQKGLIEEVRTIKSDEKLDVLSMLAAVLGKSKPSPSGPNPEPSKPDPDDD